MKDLKKVLEINKIINLIRQFIKTKPGLNKLNNLSFLKNKEEVIKVYETQKEFNKVFDKIGYFPLYSTLNMTKEINNLLKGDVLNEYKLNELKEETINLNDAYKLYKKNSNFFLDLKNVQEIFDDISINENLVEKISSSIGIDNKILDSASIKLKEIRNKLNSIDKNIKKYLNEFIKSNSDFLNDTNFVFRNGHYCVSAKTFNKSNLKGFVQDISDSGQTSFITPFEVITLENQKTRLILEEKQEVNRILFEFKELILKDRDNLINNNEIIAKIDLFTAKYIYSLKYDCVLPIISNRISLINAKHPLIDKEKCVGNNFYLDKDKSLLLISGPNAGGKTIALKTIAVLSYLVKLALPINANIDSEIPYFNKIYIDIGDSQSIEKNLSTFSSQISNISYILKNVTKNDLVVLDEICSGTDPKEGDSLSIAISQKLLKIGSYTVISSHFPNLKKYAFLNEKIECSSFYFDEKNLNPTFNLLNDVIGKSYGFIIASKYGISSEIIENARKLYLNENKVSNEDELNQITKYKLDLIKKNEILNSTLKKINEEKITLKEEKERINKEKENIKNKKIADLDLYLNQKYDEINKIYENFKKENNFKESIKKLNSISISNNEENNFSINDIVLINPFNTSGKILEIKDKKAMVLTKDGLSIETNINNLKKEINKNIKEIKVKDFDNNIYKDKSNNVLNVIGLTSYEAIEEVKNFLSNALKNEIKEVKIIHGYGSGVLRKKIWEYLKKDKNIASFNYATQNDGGYGATIVKF